MGGHGYSSLLVCYPRRVGGHGYSSLLVCYPRRAWAATGIVVCWSVCLFVCLFVCHRYIYSPGCHSTAFTAWIAFTQQYLGLNSDRL